jgi:4-amino-4-deoxy-L-arabinose transferase-like glycosyltransferase
VRTAEAEPQHAATTTGTGVRAKVAWTGVLSVTGAMTSGLLLVAGRYGYHADELYFRLLGLRHPAWGYVDQPPLLPLLHRAGGTVFGDTLWAVRLPGAACFAAMVVLGTMMTAELGGRRRAQLFAGWGPRTWHCSTGTTS